MPRLPSSLLSYARQLHPLLPPVLRACRDLQSARNELRWLLEHATSFSNGIDSKSTRHISRQKLRGLVRQRGRGKPLQYILGSEPFGELEILCRPGVLIPRPETESITSHLATILPTLFPQPSLPQPLRILDLCTGTGCIPLLLHSLLSSQAKDISLYGIDISEKAITLAGKNLRHNIQQGNLRASAQEQIRFIQDDIFHPLTSEWGTTTWDILISNPPYISPKAFATTTSRSVRNFELKTALVPHTHHSSQSTPMTDHETGDLFYPRLLEIAQQVSAKVLLMEVADMAQARRVAQMVLENGKWGTCEIWRDYPAQGVNGGNEVVEVAGGEVRVRGHGHGRAVFALRSDNADLVGEEKVN